MYFDFQLLKIYQDQSPNKVIHLNNCYISRMEESKCPGFRISVKGGRDFVFIGQNKQSIEDWFSNISNLLQPDIKDPVGTKPTPSPHGTLSSRSILAEEGILASQRPHAGGDPMLVTFSFANTKQPAIQKVLENQVMSIGRYTGQPESNDCLALRSKVVSRAHAEMWIEKTQVYIRDVGSQSICNY